MKKAINRAIWSLGGRVSDEELMGSLIKGDQKAFKELFERHHLQVFNYLWRLCGDQELAEDLTQETFIKLYHRHSTFKGGSAFAPWLWTVAKNTCRDYWRKKKELTLEDGGVEEAAEVLWTEQQESALESLIRMQNDEMVRKALLNLPELQREALSLWLSEDFSYQAMGEILERSPQAVKNLIVRAKKNLKEMIEREERT